MHLPPSAAKLAHFGPDRTQLERAQSTLEPRRSRTTRISCQYKEYISAKRGIVATQFLIGSKVILTQKWWEHRVS